MPCLSALPWGLGRRCGETESWLSPRWCRGTMSLRLCLLGPPFQARQELWFWSLGLLPPGGGSAPPWGAAVPQAWGLPEEEFGVSFSV